MSRAHAGEVLATDRVVAAIEVQRAPALRPDRRGLAEGVPGADRALRDHPRARAVIAPAPVDEPARAGARGGASPARPAARRDALRRPRLGLPARPRRPRCSAPRPSPPCTSTMACGDGVRRRRAALRRALRRGSASPLEVQRPRRPEGPGNLQSWARDARYAAAAALAAAPAALIATGHTADDQVETILYRLASSPSRRALLGMRPRDGILVRPLLALHPRADDRLLRGARPSLARRPDQRGPAYRPQQRPRPASCRRSRSPPGGRPQRAAHGRDPARRGGAPRRAGRRRARRLRRGAHGRDSRSPACGSCRRRCAASSSSGSPTAPPGGPSRARPATRRRSPGSPGAARLSTSAAASARRSGRGGPRRGSAGSGAGRGLRALWGRPRSARGRPWYLHWRW